MTGSTTTTTAVATTAPAGPVVGGNGPLIGAVSGGLSAMAASSCTHPLDLFKVRLQLQGELSTAAKQSTIIQQFKLQWSESGLLGFYRGLTATWLRQALYSTSRFGIYEYSKSIIINRNTSNNNNNNTNRDLTLSQKLLLSSISGGLGSFLSSPADLVMIRMQSDSSRNIIDRRNYTNIFNGLYRIIRDEGLFSLWRGSIPNIQRGIIVTTCQFVSYDQWKSVLLSKSILNEGFLLHLTASVLSGIIVATAASPIDVIRTRMMNSSKNSSNNKIIYRSTIDCAIQLANTEGFRGFYKGIIPYYMRVGPQVTLMFIFYEQFNQLFSKLL